MGLFDTLFGKLFTSPGAKGATKAKANRSARSFAPSSTAGPAIANLILADLDGSGGRELIATLATELADIGQVEVKSLNKPLKMGTSGNLIDRLMSAVETGKEWLDESKADLLVWGEVANASMTLRFLPRVGDADGKVGAFGLGDTLELPAQIDDLNTQTIAMVAMAAAISSRDRGKYELGGLVASYADGLAEQAKNPPSSLTPRQAATFQTCFANTNGIMWRLDRDAAKLAAAKDAYESALGRADKDKNPVDWALIQNHLASVFEARAETTKDVEPLEQASKAYRTVLEVMTQDTHPNDWALAQVRLGMALYKAANRRGKAAELKEAVGCFEASFQVYKRGSMPARWSEVMNQYGVVLMALGEMVTGDVVLDRAVKVFRTTLEVRKRDAAPLLWAQTANNLGAACFSLAKRNGEIPLLEEAIQCFEGSIEVNNEQGRKKAVAVIQKNLHRVQRLLDIRRSQG